MRRRPRDRGQCDSSWTRAPNFESQQRSALGHDVATIVRDFQASLSDRRVLEIAHREGRVLITNDRDFGELVLGEELPHAGVIYFRLPLDTTAALKIQFLLRIIDEHAADLNRFIVVTPGRIRIDEA